MLEMKYKSISIINWAEKHTCSGVKVQCLTSDGTELGFYSIQLQNILFVIIGLRKISSVSFF